MKLWIEGVYVGATYIAADCSCYQCPEYLREFYANVSPKYQGVRYDIEAGDHSLSEQSNNNGERDHGLYKQHKMQLILRDSALCSHLRSKDPA